MKIAFHRQASGTSIARNPRTSEEGNSMLIAVVTKGGIFIVKNKGPVINSQFEVVHV